MKFELNSLPRNCSKEEILNEVRRVDSLVGKDKLTTHDFDEFAKISSSIVRRKFGGWENTLIAAGLGHKYSGIVVTEKMAQQSKNLTDEEVLGELKRIAKELGQNYVTHENVDSLSKIISASTVLYRFGSWENGVKKAGLENSPGYNRKFSDEEYFENLLNVWTHYGRQPKYNEMKNAPSLISPKTYENHFGIWRKALESFVARMNQDNKESNLVENACQSPQASIQLHTDEVEGHRSLPENKHEIKLGLRYRVLNRDKFKCKRCGSSPATNPLCILHVDHIIPFSKGGKTIAENLQTLCEDCNLGKSNRHTE